MCAEHIDRFGMVTPQSGRLTGLVARFHEASAHLSSAEEGQRRAIQAFGRHLAQEPRDTTHHDDLSVSHSILGDLPGAEESYRAAPQIGERLAAAQPGNVQWRRDVWISYWRVADVLERRGAPQARAWWQRACETLTAIGRAGMLVSPEYEASLQTLRRKVGR